MPRPLRIAAAGVVYHVLNRGNAGLGLFGNDAEYAAFELALTQAHVRTPLHILACCLMPSHWHLVRCPQAEGALSGFVGWLTITHSQRWHAARGTTRAGHLYQGRFRSFPVQDDDHRLTVCRYVERNPLRAGLVERAEDWRWSSLSRRSKGDAAARALLTPWPVAPPADELAWINEPQTDEELAALRRCVLRGGPFGTAPWRD